MASRLNQRQIQELKDCFKLFDTDNSGTISTQELKKVLEALGIHATNNEVKSLMSVMDKDGSGSIDFNEFAEIMADQFYKQPSRKDLEAAFKYFDTDNSGYITEDELLKAMSKFKSGITKEEVRKMIVAIDKNSDGRISIDEFVTLMTS